MRARQSIICGIKMDKFMKSINGVEGAIQNHEYILNGPFIFISLSDLLLAAFFIFVSNSDLLSLSLLPFVWHSYTTTLYAFILVIYNIVEFLYSVPPPLQCLSLPFHLSTSPYLSLSLSL